MTDDRSPDRAGDDAVTIDEGLARRLRSGAASMATAADEHRPMPTGTAAGDPGHRPSRRRTLALAAAVVALAATAAGVLVAVRDDPADRVATSEGGVAPCESGVDLLAVTLPTYLRDEDHTEGYSTIALLRSDAPDDLTYLAESAQVISDPSVSPRGDQVAVTWADGDYESAGPSSESIWSVAANGTDARPLTTGVRHDTPRWSPDGRWVAYVSFDAATGEVSVEVVPSEGGTPRRLGAVSADLATIDLTWTTDGGEVVVAAGEDEAVVTALTLDGAAREVGRVPGPAASVTAVPGGREVMVATGSAPDEERHAVDLATGETRAIDGPAGEVRWSADGQRAYLLARDGGRTLGVHHLRFDGSTFEVGDPVAGLEPVTGFSVGPCVDTAHPPDPAEVQPLVGTLWTLGPRSIKFSDREPTEGCAASDCRAVRVDVRFETWDPAADAPVEACTAFDAELRGNEVTGQSTTAECARPIEDPTMLPVRVEVEGSRLTATYEAEHGPWTRTYGALYTRDAQAPVATPDPDGPAVDDVEVPSTTVPTPEAAPCDQVEAFAGRLAATDLRTDRPAAPSPEELAARSGLVVRGHLTDTELASDDEPGQVTFVYSLVIDEVLARRDDVALGSGDQLAMAVSFAPTGPAGSSAPAIGHLAAIDPDGGPDGAIPVVAFLTAGGVEDEWQVDGPNGLAVGCPGTPAGGWVGTGPAWSDLDLDALAERARR